MLGIDYASSDEEEVAPAPKTQQTIAKDAPVNSEATQANEVTAPSGPINGPVTGPTVSPPIADGPPEDTVPGSPYTSNRESIRSLTLPTVPNFNIPPSPPGSPPQPSSNKFARFLELKKKGQHFNQRLESSSVLRDPAHLQRLMDFAGISTEDQYASTLPEGLAVPTTFPDWAYVEELSASQKKITKAREKAPREAIDFVAAAGPRVTTGKSSHQSTTKKVALGAESSTTKHKELEYREGRNEQSSRNRWRSRSRSPKRRRSRSRERR